MFTGAGCHILPLDGGPSKCDRQVQEVIEDDVTWSRSLAESQGSPDHLLIHFVSTCTSALHTYILHTMLLSSRSGESSELPLEHHSEVD